MQRMQTPNRDKGGPHGLPPPTPPDRRVTDPAARQIESGCDITPDRSVGSRRASCEFLPEATHHPTPRRMPSRRSTPGHGSSLPFRPSARARVPTMPSADFCGAVREDASALSPRQDTPQISRGQRSSRRCLDAGLIKYAPLWREDFLVACPLVPNGPHLLSGSCPWPRPCVPRFFQTPPRGDALALPLSFGSTHTWTGDVHPQA
jgi:hypothetical protein